MTEAEALELIVGFGANATNGFAVYISFTFAFLTLSYFIGSKLSRFQSIAISVIYIIGASGPAMSAFAHLLAIHEIQKKHPTLLDGLFGWDQSVYLIWLPIIAVIGMLLSLYFLYDTRSDSS